MAQLDIASGNVVANASESERAGFIRRTYLHLGGAILAFVGVEAALIQSGIAESFVHLLQGSKWMWLVVMGMFMGVSYIADKWAHSAISKEMQYAGLGLFVLAEAIVFMPLIYIALNHAPDVLSHAALLTLMLVAGITFTAFTTRKNFSFLGPVLNIGGLIALGVIVASIIFGFTLGLVFSGIMIVFAAAAVLYSTSNIIHEYHTEQHVAASLSLFSSVGLLFWYILQFLMSLTGQD
ncbi:MAG TPA: Bax inhibitor-1 family protein [Candidatus Thiothrix moscowensis]|uniref:Bax inhibitor-1/YccA family protein n=1 Tax=unclassified Thiothrix TaxID=2636184 RepID=UPI001A2FEB89|nr:MULTISPECIES: Bax inhibitor-1 family protein [unclassified Thiothrix]MBJ6611912.1 US12 family protein [Candidatus Thiothrix moscowensis]HRJ54028.1 Bax inhibitor-1 family protein [Candidatus Thiothrix moscowensis]HRJ94110.1 Bax inhibitor-1 family protein [Candidatus Thiothrix moscowensis]